MKITLMCSYLYLLIGQGTYGILEEETYVKDGLAKIVVEMVKREWPQQWPSFMNELHELCKHGVSMTFSAEFIQNYSQQF